MGAIVARAVETARPAIDAHRHSLELDLPDELISVEGDQTRLVQVIANILHNAAKFMDPGGRIRSPSGATGTMRSSDLGHRDRHRTGTVPKIFELFTQVHAKTERAQDLASAWRSFVG